MLGIYKIIVTYEAGGKQATSSFNKRWGVLDLLDPDGSKLAGSGWTPNPLSKAVYTQYTRAYINSDYDCTDGLDKTHSLRYASGGLLMSVNGNVLLKEGTDYILGYQNNINPGIATVTITGKNKYTGSVSKSFEIPEANEK